MAHYKFTPEQMIEALEKAGGLVSYAAKMLNCSRPTVYNYIKEFPEVRAAFEDATETNLDTAEAVLLKQIRQENMTAVIFYLKTKGKHRGFVERVEIGVQPQLLQALIGELKAAGIDANEYFTYHTDQLRSERRRLQATIQ